MIELLYVTVIITAILISDICIVSIYIYPLQIPYIYIITTVLSIYYTYIWSFPKMGLPPVIIHFSMDFPWNRPAAVTWPQRGGAVLGLPRPGGAWKSRNTLRQRPMKNGAFYRDCREYRGFIGDKYIYVHIYIYVYRTKIIYNQGFWMGQSSTTWVFGWEHHLQLGDLYRIYIYRGFERFGVRLCTSKVGRLCTSDGWSSVHVFVVWFCHCSSVTWFFF